MVAAAGFFVRKTRAVESGEAGLGRQRARPPVVRSHTHTHVHVHAHTHAHTDKENGTDGESQKMYSHVVR